MIIEFSGNRPILIAESSEEAMKLMDIGMRTGTFYDPSTYRLGDCYECKNKGFEHVFEKVTVKV